MGTTVKQLRLLCVFAHPDDVSMATGGILAKYADEGIQTYLLTATRGEHGWLGDPAEYPGPVRLGQIREGELYAAATVLGLREVSFLDYVDGQLDRADPATVVAQIASHLHRIRPHVVVTFGHDGLYGHPDHVAICQYTTAATLLAANARLARRAGVAPHQVSKLYYVAPRPERMATYEDAFGELAMEIDGQRRRNPGWADWTVTTTVDTERYWSQTWSAVRCHSSQLGTLAKLETLGVEGHRRLWGGQDFYRVFSLVNGGRASESDLFDGLRQQRDSVPVPLAHQPARDVPSRVLRTAG
jgi:LmbE family N-acetylglucosaminyl deacetylase